MWALGNEPLEPAIAGSVLETKGHPARTRLPDQAGRYRVFAHVRAGKGGAGTTHVPVLAK